MSFPPGWLAGRLCVSVLGEEPLALGYLSPQFFDFQPQPGLVALACRTRQLLLFAGERLLRMCELLPDNTGRLLRVDHDLSQLIPKYRFAAAPIRLGYIRPFSQTTAYPNS